MARNKRYNAAAQQVVEGREYALKDAVALVLAFPKAKFDETVEIVICTGLDIRQSDQVLRGAISLPNGTGKTLRVAAFAKGEKAEAAKKAGADLVGDEELIAQVAKGEINFDRCVATPDMMPLLSKAAKVLGPRGLMPNPKLGSVSENIAAAVKAVKGGQVEYRAEKGGLVQAGIGKKSFNEKALLENIKAFVTAVNQGKPAGAKGIYLQKAYLSSTMGPSVTLDMRDLVAA